MNSLKLTIILVFSVLLQARGQVDVYNVKKLDQIKSGTTYIKARSVDFPGAAKYLAAVRQVWTLSKAVEFLLPDSKVVITPNDTFLSLGATSVRRGNTTNVFYYLSFWNYRESFLKKNKPLADAGHEAIAAFSLSIAAEAIMSGKSFDDLDFDGGGIFYNWSPGMLKNALQRMVAFLNAKKKINCYDDVTNKQELKNLSTETLYVPDFNLKKFSAFLGARKGSNDEGEVFEDYKFPYKIISKEEVDDLIAADKPSYYLIFVKDSSKKIVVVINSKSGEIIYSRSTNISYNLKSGDLKDLYKQIKKSGS